MTTERRLALKVMHLTTVDMSLALLIGPQLDAVRERGGVAIGVSASGPFIGALEGRGIRHIALKSSTRRRSLMADLRTAAELWKVLRAERPTILHTHNPKPGLYGRVIGRLAGVPIVVNTVHGLYATPDDPALKRAVVYGLEWVASRFSNAELVQNPEDLALMRRLRLTPRRRLHLLGNGVNLHHFASPSPGARTRVRADWGIADDTVVVGTVGRLVAEKGYPELFEAARGVKGTRLVVIGPEDPDKRDALDPALIARAAAEGTVFGGFRDDMADVYAAFDVFVLASHREGFPRAAMEAAAAGLPIVTTDIRGCREIVVGGHNGLLVPVGSADALREAITRLGADPPLRHRFGQASAARARSRFDERAVVERVMACYAEAAERRHILLVPDPRG